MADECLRTTACRCAACTGDGILAPEAAAAAAAAPVARAPPRAAGGTAPAARALTIQTGIISRLCRDLDSYQAEAAAQEAVVARLEAEGADSHDIAKQREVLGETTGLMPWSLQRLQDGLGALEDALLDAEGQDGVAEAVQAAQAVLEDARARLPEEE